MANQLYTPAQVATVAATLIKEDGYLSGLVSKNYTDQFLGPATGGAPVSIKMPTTLIARTRSATDVTTAIVLDEVAETFKTINLDKDMSYSAVPLSEADLAFNLTDFGSQILKPQTDAIVDSIEHKIATRLLAVPTSDDIVWDASKPVTFFTQLRKKLRDNGVEQAGIQVTVGTSVYAALLEAELITDVSQSGATQALREGGVGRIRGFNIVESTRLGEDEVIAFHKDAVTLVTRAPVVPQGASFGATVSAGGYSLRYLRDYDAMHTVDRSIVSAFSGVGILPTYKVERNYDTRAVSVTELENGGVLHYETTASA